MKRYSWLKSKTNEQLIFKDEEIKTQNYNTFFSLL